MITQLLSFKGRAARIALPLFVFALACGDDPADLNIDEAFIGNWNSTSFVVDGEELMTPGSSFFVSFGFFSDGSYQVLTSGDEDRFLCDVAPSCADNGDFAFAGNVITLDPGTVDELALQYSVTVNTLTVSGNFDGAPFTATFVRN